MLPEFCLSRRLRGETGRRLLFCKTAHFAKPSQCQRSYSAITHGTCILYHFPDFPANPAELEVGEAVGLLRLPLTRDFETHEREF